MSKPYSPLDVNNLGASILRAILVKDPVPLGGVTKFYGVGIYALYYTGDFTPYKIVSDRNADGAFSQPIYVGIAIPPGGRTGLLENDGSKTTKLFTRIREHAKSVDSVANLNISDFHVRWLVVEPVWIPLGESLLIAATAPVWNIALAGFGSHTPVKARNSSQLSKWDRVHPGRGSMSQLAPHTGPVEELIDAVQVHLASSQGVAVNDVQFRLRLLLDD